VSALLQFIEAAGAIASPIAAASDDASAAAALPTMSPLPAAVPALAHRSEDESRSQQSDAQPIDTEAEAHHQRHGRRGDGEEDGSSHKRKREDDLTDTAGDDTQSNKRTRGGSTAATAGRNGRPTRPCHDWQRFGNCKRGASCFFAHEPKSSQSHSQQSTSHFASPLPMPAMPLISGQWNPQQIQMQQQQMAAMHMQMQQQFLMQQQGGMHQQQQQLQQTHNQPSTHAPRRIATMDEEELEIPLTGRGAHPTHGAPVPSVSAPLHIAATADMVAASAVRGGFAARGAARGGMGGLGFQQARGGISNVPVSNMIPFSYGSGIHASEQKFVSASSPELPASHFPVEHKEESLTGDDAQEGGIATEVNNSRDAQSRRGDDVDEDGGEPPIVSSEEYFASLPQRGAFGRGGARGGATRGGRGGRGGGRGGGFAGSDAGNNAISGGNESGTRLFLTQVPAELNSLVSLSQHFAQFGSIQSIKKLGDDRAIVEMGSHAEAKAARDSPQAILGNRFIQVDWARGDGTPAPTHNKNQQQSQPRKSKPHFHPPPPQPSPPPASTHIDVAPPAAPLSAVEVARALMKSNAAKSQPTNSSLPQSNDVATSDKSASLAALKAQLLQKQLTTQKELLARLTGAEKDTLPLEEKRAIMTRLSTLTNEIKSAQSVKPVNIASNTLPTKKSALQVVAAMRAAAAASQTE
jgi:hypothetical protein